MPEITIETDKKPSYGRFNVRIKNDDKVLLTGRVDPYKPDEIESIVTRAQEQLPGLNGHAEMIREHLLNLASGPVVRKAPVAAAGENPTILIDVDEHRVVAQTIDAMAKDPKLFCRGNMLVRVLNEGGSTDGIQRSDGSPTISIAPAAFIRERITTVAGFTKMAKQGDQIVEAPSHPTAWLVSAIHVRGYWDGLRKLNGVSEVPILRADGSICQTPGYDPSTGVLYMPTSEFPAIPEDVTLDDADAARERLLEVVCDFRFEANEHRAAWLAALLTALGRFAFDGPSPLFLVDANVRGAGKGLALQAIGQIVLGREMPVSSYSHDPEEMRKKITAIALAGDRVINLDNLDGPFGNDALDRALTSTRWKDRILGKSEEVDLPLLPVWFATGNNVAVAADTCRRIIHIRLDVLEELPEQRSGFKHPDLIAWIRSNRPQLLVDALTILSAYCRAGRPSGGLSPFGSFEGWSGLVREAVVWLGLPDPCLTRAKLAESSDTVSDSLGQLLDAWQEFDPHNSGIAVADTLTHLFPRMLPPTDLPSVAMRSAIEAFVACPPGKAPTARQLGNKLRHIRRRVVGRRYLDVDSSQHRNTGAVWRVYSA